jgi:DNA replication protein DnaC
MPCWDWSEAMEKNELGIYPWAKSFDDHLKSLGLRPEQYEARVREMQRKEEREAMAERLMLAAPRVTPELQAAIVTDRLQPTPAVIGVKTWLDVAHRRVERVDRRRPVILVLAGSVGVGKTVASAYALAQVGGEYIPAVELVDRMFAAPYQRDHRRPGGALVVVDDVGTERHKDFDSALFELVDIRMHRGGALTILTTNLSQAQFQSRYDARIVDRLREAATFLEFHQPSLRIRGAA